MDDARAFSVPCGGGDTRRRWTNQSCLRTGSAGLLPPLRAYAYDEPDLFEQLRVGAEQIRLSRVIAGCKDTAADLVVKGAESVLTLRRGTEEADRIVNRLAAELGLAEKHRDRATTVTAERLALFGPLVRRFAVRATFIEAAYDQGRTTAILQQQQRDARERERGERADANRRQANECRSHHIERCAFAEFHPSDKDS